MTRKPFEGADQKVQRIVSDASERERVRFEEEYYSLEEYCESPIEKLLLAGLFLDHRVHEFDVIFMGKMEPSERHIRGETIYIYQQAQIAPYRVDFLIHDCSMPLELQSPRWMVVECDGHDFHERTKEQARRDKQRDRFFQSRNYKVLRFTGSEIFADPEGVAEEVLGELARDDNWRNRAQ